MAATPAGAIAPPIPATIHPILDAVAPAVEPLRAPVMPGLGGSVGGAVETRIDAIAPAIHPIVDAVAPAIQSIFPMFQVALDPIVRVVERGFIARHRGGGRHPRQRHRERQKSSPFHTSSPERSIPLWSRTPRGTKGFAAGIHRRRSVSPPLGGRSPPRR